jgi:uncharacterized protein (TIGR02145 family)
MKQIFILLLLSMLILNSCEKDEPMMSGLPVIVSPTQISPTDGASVQQDTVTFTWRKVIGVTGYALQISLDSNFSNCFYNQSGLTDTSIKITGLGKFHIYFWRLNSILYDATTPWSTVWRFTPEAPCPGMSTVTYQGKTYNTVKIGNQCWLKGNLDVGIMIQGTVTAKNNGVIEKYCYNNDPNVCNTYGALYQWNEAMQYTTTAGTRGICPPDWHIPTYAEYQTLSTTVGGYGNALKEIGQGTGEGAGTNASGFSALLAGDRIYYGPFDGLGGYAYIWSSTEYGAYDAYYMILNYGSNITYDPSPAEGYGFSIRCIKD